MGAADAATGASQHVPETVELTEVIVVVAEPININSFVHGTHTRERDIRVSEFIVDDSYQRKLNGSWVSKIVREFDPTLFDKPLVSMRSDGRYAVIDGQHRIEAIRLMHGTNDVFVRCDVVAEGLDVSDEARKFKARNHDIRKTSVSENFKAKLAMSDPAAMEIVSIVRECGFDISPSSFGGTAQIAAVGLLERIYSQPGRSFRNRTTEQGPTQLRRTLGILRDAEYGKRPLLAESIAGVNLFLNRYGSHENFNRERLVNILRSTTASDFRSDVGSLAKTMRIQSGAAAGQILLHRYNARINERNRLPAWE